MSGILCLKWNNHTSTFIKTLDNLRSKELYCDATIACNGRYFPVHRFVLTTCSEYFEDIFERTHCKHPFVIIKDIEELHLESLLNYMYNGEVNVLQDRLPGLIRAAEALKIRGLAICEENNGNTSPDGRKLTKEKKKSIHSSPSLPKNKKNGDRSQVLKQSDHDTTDMSVNNDNEDEITELNEEYDRSFSSRNETQIAEDLCSNGEISQQNEVPRSMDTENKDLQHDVKLESSEIFEAVEEEFPPPTNAGSSEKDKEGSLFVSLLSPNNANSSEDESSSHAIPQCSSWADGAGSKSDDEVVVLDDIKMEIDEEFLSESHSPIEITATPKNKNGKLKVPSQCPHCSYQSRYKTNLKTHIARLHDGIQPFSCSLCVYKTSTKESLKIHMRKHTGEKPYKCSFCSYRAAHYNSIKVHTSIHSGDKPYQCKQCPYATTRKSTLMKHVKLHTK